MEEIEIDELVAKRCGPIGRELMAAAREGHLCLQKETVIEGCVELTGAEAVSYTHLDVYKRQLLCL